MTRLSSLILRLAPLLLGCASARTPEQLALLKRGDCRALLLAADEARAEADKRLARELASACPQSGLETLVQSAKAPAEAFLWCGRARAALVERTSEPSCKPEKINHLLSELRPRLTLGPAD